MPYIVPDQVKTTPRGYHNSIKTHCPHGHLYDEKNTYVNRLGSRECRACDRKRLRDRANAHQCLDCGEAVPDNQRRCLYHRAVERTRAKKRREDNPARAKQINQNLRNRRIASGLCISCKSPAALGNKLCERHRKIARDRATRHEYNLTHDELEMLRKATHCALCGGKFHGSRQDQLAPHIDHDHKTGLLRAVIHKKCNTALGMFEEDEMLLLAAIKYLKRYSNLKKAA